MGTNNNTIKYTLPELRELELSNLPQLTSIFSTDGVMVCGSLRHMKIIYCPKLKRFPLYLDKGKPSSLNEICVDPKEWWESVEWDYPNAKDVLQPLLKFWDDSSRQWMQASDEASLKA